MEGDVLTTVPEELKRLVRMIIRGFYTMEHAVVIDMLVRHPCVKEDDLAELLKYEKKHIRSILNMLKNEKFLKNRMRVETDAEGHTTRHLYYFINYSLFVNVVKFKLDHMRRRIETEERDSTARSSFRCPTCAKTFTDLEVGQLLDPFTGNLICTYCQSIVEEDESSIPKQDARTVLARFNEQIQPLYELLRACEDVKLAPELLDPEPTDLNDLKKMVGRGSAPSSRRQADGERTAWSGDATRNTGFGFNENRVTITMEDDSSQRVERKAQPVWMTQSTIDGTPADATSSTLPSAADASTKKPKGGEDVLQTLLAHESGAGRGSGGFPGTSSPAINSPSQSQSDGGGSDWESEEEDAGPLVAVGGQRLPYNQITADMVAGMSTLEKQEYIRVGQQLYENIYD